MLAQSYLQSRKEKIRNSRRVLVGEITSPGKNLMGFPATFDVLSCNDSNVVWIHLSESVSGLAKHRRAVSTWSELVILNSPMSTMSLKKFLQKCTTSFINTLQNISIRWFAVERPTRKLFSPDILSPWWSLNNRCASRITIFSVPASLRIILGKVFFSIIYLN